MPDYRRSALGRFSVKKWRKLFSYRFSVFTSAFKAFSYLSAFLRPEMARVGVPGFDPGPTDLHKVTGGPQHSNILL